MMLQCEDITETGVVVHLRNRTPIPRSPEIEPRAMLTLAGTSGSVTRCTLQAMSISENVEPYCNPNALA